MPAYNAEKTLERTLDDIDRPGWTRSFSSTTAAATERSRWPAGSGLRVFVHEKNTGYGGNQKTCYTEALKLGAEIMIMVHPDHQYDPRVIPQLVQPLLDGDLRRRLRFAHARRPAARRRHAQVEIPGQHLPDGRRERHVLHVPDRIPFGLAGLFPPLPRDASISWRIRTISSSIRRSSPRASFTGCGSGRSRSKRAISPRPRRSACGRSIVYGLSILKTLVKFKLHKKGLASFAMFNGPAGSRTGMA